MSAKPSTNWVIKHKWYFDISGAINSITGILQSTIRDGACLLLRGLLTHCRSRVNIVFKQLIVINKYKGVSKMVRLSPQATSLGESEGMFSSRKF